MFTRFATLCRGSCPISRACMSGPARPKNGDDAGMDSRWLGWDAWVSFGQIQQTTRSEK